MKFSFQTSSSLSNTPSTETPASESKKLVESCHVSSILVPSKEKADITSSDCLTKPEVDSSVESSPIVEVCSLNHNCSYFGFWLR